MKAIAAIVAVVVVLILVGLGITLLSGGLTILLAPFQGEVEKSQQVEGSGEYRVANHDYFYNLCSDIQTKQDNIESLKAQLKYADGDTKQKIQSGIAGNELELNKLVNKYNADASNEYSKGQFRDDELPYHIEADQEVQSCGTV